MSGYVASYIVTVTKLKVLRNEDPYFRLLVYDNVLSEYSGFLGYKAV
jgi:hypothetical protein